MLYIILILIIIFLFLIFPSVRRHNDRNSLKGKFIAHRGLHSLEENTPENSMPAFLEAAARGYLIEIDIRLTKDGEVVIFHDDSLKRMCGEDIEVRDLTLLELKEYRLGATNEKIPTLKELLNAVEGRVALLIEFKCDGKNCNELCERANAILSGYDGEYYIQSFYPGVPFWYNRHNKKIFRGQLATVYEGKGIMRHIFSPFIFNFLSRPDFVSYDEKHANRFMFWLQKVLGAYPIGWTFETQEAFSKDKKKFKSYIFEKFLPR